VRREGRGSVRDDGGGRGTELRREQERREGRGEEGRRGEGRGGEEGYACS